MEPNKQQVANEQRQNHRASIIGGILGAVNVILVIFCLLSLVYLLI